MILDKLWRFSFVIIIIVFIFAIFASMINYNPSTGHAITLLDDGDDKEIPDPSGDITELTPLEQQDVENAKERYFVDNHDVESAARVLHHLSVEKTVRVCKEGMIGMDQVSCLRLAALERERKEITRICAQITPEICENYENNKLANICYKNINRWKFDCEHQISFMQ